MFVRPCERLCRRVSRLDGCISCALGKRVWFPDLDEAGAQKTCPVCVVARTGALCAVELCYDGANGSERAGVRASRRRGPRDA